MKKPSEDESRLGKTAFEAFYRQHRVGVRGTWEDQPYDIRLSWMRSAQAVVKERNRLNWEKNMAETRLFG
jgi:hypothetical protein